MKSSYILRVRMPDDMQALLKKTAKQNGTTVSYLVRKLIETNLITG